MNNILDKTERMLCLRNYSQKTRKAYLLYIKKIRINFKNNLKTPDNQGFLEIGRAHV